MFCLNTLCGCATQAEVFENFLNGESLQQCYAAVGAVADRWLDFLEVPTSLTACTVYSRIKICKDSSMSGCLQSSQTRPLI